MGKKDIQLSVLVDVKVLESVFKEATTIIKMFAPDYKIDTIKKIFDDTVSLFNGKFEGYRECNTPYHNLKHTTDTFLATVRLIHGATIDGISFLEKEITLALGCALFHDAGYIQSTDDTVGTGAKYTASHVQRSIVFAQKYFSDRKLDTIDKNAIEDIIMCTSLKTDIDKVLFKTENIEIIGKILGTADLISQTSDRTYLEKLLLLFYEFKEGNFGDYKDEMDLLQKTFSFFELMKNRLEKDLGGLSKLALNHFKARWKIDENLYATAQEKNMLYLEHIIKNHERDYKDYLKRGAFL